LVYLFLQRFGLRLKCSNPVLSHPPPLQALCLVGYFNDVCAGCQYLLALRADFPAFIAPALLFFVVVEEAAQVFGAAGVAEFAQGFGFYLANAFTGDVKLFADFFQGVVGVHVDAKAHT